MTGLVSIGELRKKEKGQGRDERACSVLATWRISPEWKLNEHRFSLLWFFVFLLKELNWEEGEAMAMQHPKAPQRVTYVVHNSEARPRGLWPYFNFCIDSITPPWDCWGSSVMHQGEKWPFGSQERKEMCNSPWRFGPFTVHGASWSSESHQHQPLLFNTLC